MNQPLVSYTKGAYHADVGVVQTTDGRFQGSVKLMHSSEPFGEHEHLVPVASDTLQEALDEAKALAHRLLADLQ